MFWELKSFVWTYNVNYVLWNIFTFKLRRFCISTYFLVYFWWKGSENSRISHYNWAIIIPCYWRMPSADSYFFANQNSSLSCKALSEMPRCVWLGDWLFTGLSSMDTGNTSGSNYGLRTISSVDSGVMLTLTSCSDNGTQSRSRSFGSWTGATSKLFRN